MNPFKNWFRKFVFIPLTRLFCVRVCCKPDDKSTSSVLEEGGTTSGAVSRMYEDSFFFFLSCNVKSSFHKFVQ